MSVVGFHYMFLPSTGDSSASVATENSRQHDALSLLSRDQGKTSGTDGSMEGTVLQNDKASMSASEEWPSQGTVQQPEVVMLPCR